MYSLAIYLYMFAANVAALFGNRKARLMMRGHRETWRTLRDKIRPEDRPVWFHAASLGEFEQGRVLMERLRRERPDEKILLTFFSPSGYEVRKDYEGADIVCYLPFDTMLNARKFLHLAHPRMAVFIKYEFWADYLYQCHRHGVPVYSVSSIFRHGQIFFRRWNCGYSVVLKWVTHFFVQNEESRRLLAAKGLTNVTVTGDTRLDRVVQIKEAARPLPLIEKFTADGAPVFIAGSSWPPDEDVYIPYFANKPAWRLIVATHEVNPERTAALRARLEAAGRRVALYSELQADAAAAEGADTLLIDCFGLLSSIYRYATVAYIGGGFGVSIHNVPEAAVYGVPVIFGPVNQKFQEAQVLKACGGAFEIDGADAFAALMDRFEADPAAREQAGRAAGDYIARSSGAACRIYQAIFA
ncbi:MAG: 3-deoxy-D-manno-octulosonic acid transferase [Bacteroidaceae bacterium]|nr:3-deoxy-D-manno-octulosonic acid transferase [Bacteroidaceae bacterium]